MVPNIECAASGPSTHTIICPNPCELSLPFIRHYLNYETTGLLANKNTSQRVDGLLFHALATNDLVPNYLLLDDVLSKGGGRSHSHT